MSAEAAAIAERAAEIIQARGICKGAMVDDQGHVCLWGALQDAMTDENGFVGSLFQAEIHWALNAEFYDDVSPWPGSAFNDRPETTATDVTKVLLQLADSLRLGETS